MGVILTTPLTNWDDPPSTGGFFEDVPKKMGAQ